VCSANSLATSLGQNSVLVWRTVAGNIQENEQFLLGWQDRLIIIPELPAGIHALTFSTSIGSIRKVSIGGNDWETESVRLSSSKTTNVHSSETVKYNFPKLYIMNTSILI
jgi:hypothetical protein